jgi:hypothetical protein
MIVGKRKEKELGIRWNRTNRSKEYRGKRVKPLTASLYAKNDREFRRYRCGLNESIVHVVCLRLNRPVDVPMCPMRRWK